MFKFLSSTQNMFLSEVVNNGGTLSHDYSNELHYKYALEVLGGKEHIKKNYPLVFKLFERAKENSELGIKLKTNDDPALDGFSDSMKVRDISYDNQYIVSAMSAKYRADKPSIAISARLVDKSNENVVGTLNIYGEDDTDSLDGQIAKLASELISSDDKEFSTIADFYYMDEDEYGNPVVASCSTLYNDFKVEGTNTIVANFVVNKPTTEKNPSRDKVVIVYNREAQVHEDYDYAYDNNKYKQGDREMVKVYIPVTATVTLSDGFSVIGLNKDMGCVLQIEDLNKGVVNHYGGFDSIQTEINNNVIKWTFPEYWQNALDVSNFGAKTTVNIYNKMELNIKKNSTGMFMHIPVVFQSKGSPSGDRSSIISKPIFIQWGCLGKNTKVLMPDKTYKEISEIKIGEMVLNEKMEEIKVTNIYSGEEEKMILIETTGNKKVLVTSGHPVCTMRGNIAAREINASDMIKTLNGFEEIYALQIVDYNDTVYNLCFEKENIIICDEIAVGDYAMQNNLKPSAEPKKAVTRSKECINARNQFKKLFDVLALNK